MSLDVSRYTKILDGVEGRGPEMLERLIHWGNINSGSGNPPGLMRMFEELKQVFSAWDVDINVVMVNGSTSAILHIVNERPDARKRILFSGHMDTVYEPDHPFQTCRLSEDQRFLHGPGVADMKGGLLVMLESIFAFENYGPSRDVAWEIIISPDEETGSVGSGPLLKEAADRCDLGLVFEPALEDGSFARSRPGNSAYTAKATGRASHVGRHINEGRNALEALCDVSMKVSAAIRDIPGAICNLGKIEGGGAVNVVPDSGEASFNIRVRRAQDIETVEELLATVSEKVEKERGVQIEWSGGFSQPPKEIGPEAEAMFAAYSECANALGMNIGWKDTGGCCDGNKLAAAGLVNLDTLGVNGGGIHSDREFMEIDSLISNTKRTALFLMAVADGSLEL